MRKTLDSRAAEVTQVCFALCSYGDTFFPNTHKKTGVPGEEDLTTLTDVEPLKQAEKQLHGTLVLPCVHATLSPAQNIRWSVGAEVPAPEWVCGMTAVTDLNT